MVTKIALLLLAFLVVAILYLRFGVPRISGAEAHELVQNGAVLVDVRTPPEFAGGHIKGAINIPIRELRGRLDELGDDSSEIVVYCQSGGRSAMAKRILERNGFEHVHDLGGIGRW
jgi:phage shock protein E